MRSDLAEVAPLCAQVAWTVLVSLSDVEKAGSPSQERIFARKKCFSVIPLSAQQNDKKTNISSKLFIQALLQTGSLTVSSGGNPEDCNKHQEDPASSRYLL